MTLKGYDLDGTLLRGIAPQQRDHPIITGRSWGDYNLTMRQLKSLGFDEWLIYFNPIHPFDVNPYTAAIHKSNIIKRLGVQEYYEDSIFQALFIDMATDADVYLVEQVDVWGEVEAKPLPAVIRPPKGAYQFPYYVPYLVNEKKILPLWKIIWEGVYGELPPGSTVTFADGDPQNWHLSNIRIASANAPNGSSDVSGQEPL
jgi:hypothetical protein